MVILVQFAIGLVFGLGLIVAGMSDPAKVLNFLDLAAISSGGWDASLAFVMVGAIVVTFIGFKLVLRRRQPIFGEHFHLPTATDLNARIVAGPAIFGIGWGLAGFCPGPALTAALTCPRRCWRRPLSSRCYRWSTSHLSAAPLSIPRQTSPRWP
jgi:uncharacterized membrane protein YedE/YeeE